MGVFGKAGEVLGSIFDYALMSASGWPGKHCRDWEAFCLLQQRLESADGAAVSLKEREARRIRDTSFVYGDTPTSVFLDVAWLAGLGRGDVFLDLGSGKGSCVLNASFFCRKAVGYELLSGLVKESSRLKQELEIGNADFFCKNLLEADVSGADVVYVPATTFSENFLQKTEWLLEGLKPGARVVVTGGKFHSSFFREYLKREFYFSWNDCKEFWNTLRFYTRV